MLTKDDLEQIGEVVEKKIKPLKKDVSYIKKTIKVLVARTDREETHLRKRVERIEKHLDLPTLQ